MPKFMDVHNMPGATKADVAAAHQKDLSIEKKHGVHFEKYWLDERSGKVFCLSEAPNAEAAKRVHAEAGHPTDEIYPVFEGQ